MGMSFDRPFDKLRGNGTFTPVPAQAEFAELLGGFHPVMDLGVESSALHCGVEEVGDVFAVVGDV